MKTTFSEFIMQRMPITLILIAKRALRTSVQGKKNELKLKIHQNKFFDKIP